MCIQYIRGSSVHWSDTMSTSGEYHEYIWGYSVNLGIPWVHRGYHGYIGGGGGGIMMHVGRYHEYIGVFNIN